MNIEQAFEAVGSDIKQIQQHLAQGGVSGSATNPNTNTNTASPLNPETVFSGYPSYYQNTIIDLSQSVIGRTCIIYWQDAYLSGFGSEGSGIYATQHAFVPAFPNKVDFAHSITAAIVPSDSGLSTMQIAYSKDGRRLRLGRNSGNNYRILRVDIIG